MNVYSSMTQLGTVKFCYSENGQNYGIHQATSSNTSLLNYFDDNVKVGKATLDAGKQSDPGIITDPYVTNFKFTMNPNSGPAQNPLTITGEGITVSSKVVSDELQLLTGAGNSKILMSDEYGNGNWTDPSQFNDNDWLFNHNGDIYTTARRVGIGTDSPTQKLEICHSDTFGGVVINQVSKDTSINTNEIRFERSGTEKFALGYWVSSGRPSFFIWNHINQRTALFIRGDNNKVGIDTEWPKAKLHVNGDMSITDKLGIGCLPPTDDLYKLFVEGGIEARDIKVTVLDYPDYCFKTNYNLMPIEELRTYVETNKHLPGIPTAKEIEENNGVELGKMQTNLLKKIEEQTLYILDLQKQIYEMKKQMSLFINK
jgi:hypothetical protein